MKCELIQDKTAPGVFRVEAIDNDGGIEVAVFSGPHAFERAIHFAGAVCGPYYDSWGDPEDCVSIGEITRRRFGRDHTKPCADPAMLTCAMWKCQVRNRCRKALTSAERIIKAPAPRNPRTMPTVKDR